LQLDILTMKFTSTNKDKSDLKIIIITSIITTLLSTIAQYALQKNQLSNEQSYWTKRYNIENLQRTNDVRMKIIEDLSSEILQLEVQAKEIKLQSVVVQYEKNEQNLEELKQLVIKYHKDLYKVSSKIEIASVYFDNNVDINLQKLGKALADNYQNNYIKESTSDTSLIEFNRDFETIEKLSKVKKETFENMLKNMNTDWDETSKK
jgi:hypothetical protein